METDKIPVALTGGFAKISNLDCALRTNYVRLYIAVAFTGEFAKISKCLSPTRTFSAERMGLILRCDGVLIDEFTKEA
jgi:hypothetical protein